MSRPGWLGAVAAIALWLACPGPAGAQTLAAGSLHTCAIRAGHSIACWGSNAYGELGDGTTEQHSAAVTVEGITDAVAVAAGSWDTCAIVASGHVLCWGLNESGQLGIGEHTGPQLCGPASVQEPCSTVPQTVDGIAGAVGVSVSEAHACAVLGGGGVRCWGDNTSGQLGTGEPTGPQDCSDIPDFEIPCADAPVAVPGLDTATGIAAAMAHTCALLADGTVSCWGRETGLALDENGEPVNSPTPVPVNGIAGATAIAAGGNHGSKDDCAILSTHRISCWGSPGFGALGNGSVDDVLGPQEVAGVDDAASVSVGYAGSCALRQSGAVVCWGDGGTGQLGAPTDESWSPVPVRVTDVPDAVAVAAGGGHGFGHACAAILDGRIYCWGDNARGELGDGMRESRTVHAVRVEDPASPTTVRRMLAFGDSYTSGEGLVSESGLQYDCGTDVHRNLYYENTTVEVPRTIWTPFDCDLTTMSHTEPSGWLARRAATYENLCHRTARAYPNQIRVALGVQASDYQFVACSGAKTGNVGLAGNPWAEFSDSPSGVAGGRTQIATVDPSFLSDPPDLVTIGVGGDDADFGQIIERCLHDCLADQDWIDAELDNVDGYVFGQVRTTLEALVRKFPRTTIVAFGYPSIVGDPDQACARTGVGPYKLNKPELLWARDTFIPALNDAIEEAAAEAGVVYADITEATQGHELCSEGVTRYINGVRTGDDQSLPVLGTVIGRESFHPNQWGHDAIAAYFLEHFTDGHGHLTVRNPAPTPETPVPGGPSLYNGSVDVDIVPATGCVQSCALHVGVDGFAPATTLTVTLHSDPVVLGTLTTDADGSAAATFTVPADLAAGYHYVEVTGDAAVLQYGSRIVKLPGPSGTVASGESASTPTSPAAVRQGAAVTTSSGPRAARGPASKPSLGATLSVRWRVGHRSTQLTRLIVRNAVRGMRVRASCARHRCRTRVRTISRTRATLDLTRSFPAVLRPHTVFTIVLTKPGAIGKRYTFLVRARIPPRRTVVADLM